MSYYLILDLLILAPPLALSFDRRVAFHRHWPEVFAAIAAIVLIFGAWDVWKTALGVWSFDPALSGQARLLGLPLPEWLFFIVVPYACLFVLACVRAYLPDTRRPLRRAPALVAALAFALPLPFVLERTYTAAVLGSAALVLAWGALARTGTLRSRDTWLALALTYLPFAVANGILTGKPVVLYDDTRNLGLRLGSIPIEDFVFSFSMILASFLFYDHFAALRAARRIARGAAP